MSSTNRVVIKTPADAQDYLDSVGLLSLATIENGHVVESASCGRCGGSGYGPWFQDGGRCYECGGRNTSNAVKKTPLVKYARAVRRRELARAKRIAAATARREAALARKLESQRTWCENNGHGRITFEELDAQREAARLAKAATMSHVGTPKKRETFAVTLDRVASFERTPFGRRYFYSNETETVWIHLFSDADGNRLVWKSTNLLTDEQCNAYPDGTKLTIKATVKEHAEYRGEPQTVIQRVTLISVDHLPAGASEAA